MDLCAFHVSRQICITLLLVEMFSCCESLEKIINEIFMQLKDFEELNEIVGSHLKVVEAYAMEITMNITLGREKEKGQRKQSNLLIFLNLFFFCCLY